MLSLYYTYSYTISDTVQPCDTTQISPDSDFGIKSATETVIILNSTVE